MLYFLGNSLLILMVIAETISCKLFDNESFNLKEVVFNMNSGHITLWCIRGIELAGYTLLLHRFNLRIVDSLHPILLWVVTIFLWDLCFYWYHRIHHNYSWLWGIHVVHHEGEEYNLSLGLRNSWYSALTTIPFFAILAILGVPFEVYAIVTLGHYFIQFWNHNSWFQSYGPLDLFLTSPAHHKVHHGKQEIYRNKNFAGTFNIWDKIFHTFQVEQDTPIEVGVAKPFKSFDVIKANNQYFFKILGIKIRQSTPSRYQLNDVFIITLACGIFCVFLHYVYYEDIWTLTQKMTVFITVFIGTVSLGNLSEGRWTGVWLWCVNVTIWMPAVGVFFIPFDATWLFLNAMLLVLTALLASSFSRSSTNSKRSTKS